MVVIGERLIVLLLLMLVSGKPSRKIADLSDYQVQPHGGLPSGFIWHYSGFSDFGSLDDPDGKKPALLEPNDRVTVHFGEPGQVMSPIGETDLVEKGVVAGRSVSWVITEHDGWIQIRRRNSRAHLA
ncbi:MAG TPA: hypothetical protein VGS07_08535 [Thermoanaerobaculia bacterium]|jgi:hypothetical protein|nr:hypothetical protein [Thermoanaerobaculia bacterium]